MSKTSQILLVEDSNEDYVTTMRAFKEVRMANKVVRCEDGDQALAAIQAADRLELSPIGAVGQHCRHGIDQGPADAQDFLHRVHDDADGTQTQGNDDNAAVLIDGRFGQR